MFKETSKLNTGRVKEMSELKFDRVTEYFRQQINEFKSYRQRVTYSEYVRLVESVNAKIDAIADFVSEFPCRIAATGQYCADCDGMSLIPLWEEVAMAKPLLHRILASEEKEAFSHVCHERTEEWDAEAQGLVQVGTDENGWPKFGRKAS